MRGDDHHGEVRTIVHDEGRLLCGHSSVRQDERKTVLPPPIAIEIKKNAANNVQKACPVSANFTDNPGVLISCRESCFVSCK